MQTIADKLQAYDTRAAEIIEQLRANKFAIFSVMLENGRMLQELRDELDKPWVRNGYADTDRGFHQFLLDNAGYRRTTVMLCLNLKKLMDRIEAEYPDQADEARGMLAEIALKEDLNRLAEVATDVPEDKLIDLAYVARDWGGHSDQFRRALAELTGRKRPLRKNVTGGRRTYHTEPDGPVFKGLTDKEADRMAKALNVTVVHLDEDKTLLRRGVGVPQKSPAPKVTAVKPALVDSWDDLWTQWNKMQLKQKGHSLGLYDFDTWAFSQLKLFDTIHHTERTGCLAFLLSKLEELDADHE